MINLICVSPFPYRNGSHISLPIRSICNLKACKNKIFQINSCNLSENKYKFKHRFIYFFTGYKNMARVTVEDCIDKIPNRYELLMVAAQRAKDLSAGAPMTVEKDNDKNPVIALREIAENTVNIEELQRSLVMGLQKYVEVEEPEEEELEILAAEKELSDLDEQFSAVSLETGELDDNMQIRDGDESIDLDAETDNDIPLDEMDDGMDVGEDFDSDFDEEE